mmetsp:Transcript_4792/g.13558  ORF Transcript_4792/g.13558 Transcript_4792/m.13558 type:complete len:501 (+) Transcript_4792:765-2267(+)
MHDVVCYAGLLCKLGQLRILRERLASLHRSCPVGRGLLWGQTVHVQCTHELILPVGVPEAGLLPLALELLPHVVDPLLGPLPAALDEDRQYAAVVLGSVALGIDRGAALDVRQDHAEELLALVAARALDDARDGLLDHAAFEHERPLHRLVVDSRLRRRVLGLVLARHLSGAAVVALHDQVHSEVVWALLDGELVIAPVVALEAQLPRQVVVDDNYGHGRLRAQLRGVHAGIDAGALLAAIDDLGVAEVDVELLVGLECSVIDDLEGDGEQLDTRLEDELIASLHVIQARFGRALPGAELDTSLLLEVAAPLHEHLAGAGVLDHGVAERGELDGGLLGGRLPLLCQVHDLAVLRLWPVWFWHHLVRRAPDAAADGAGAGEDRGTFSGLHALSARYGADRGHAVVRTTLSPGVVMVDKLGHNTFRERLTILRLVLLLHFRNGLGQLLLGHAPGHDPHQITAALGIPTTAPEIPLVRQEGHCDKHWHKAECQHPFPGLDDIF